MSGKINFVNYAILFIAVFASTTDLLWGKIFNWFTLPCALAGMATSFYLAGWNGVFQAVLGLVAGFVFYGWMFGLKVMGGGDVKLLMALGTWGGFRYTEEVAILGVLVGGVFSIGILLYKKRIFSFSQKLYRFLLSLMIKDLSLEIPKIDRTLTLPFGIPISIAAVWVAYGHPLEHLGFLLWP
jgi:prepilin peptidase CpaA